MKKWLPSLQEGHLEKVSELYKAKTGGLDKRNKRRNRGVLGNGGAEWKWPQQACTTMFFLIPENRLC